MSMTSKQGLERLYSIGAPLIRSPMGHKKIGHVKGVAVLTRVFFTIKCMAVNEVAVRRGFTVLILGNNFSE